MTRKMSSAALKILNERYFLKDDQGKVIEDWDGLCKRVAKYIASADGLYEKEFYDMLYERLFLPNTPTLMNAGKKDMGGLHACFVIDIEDSMGNENLGHGITDSWKAAALIGKEGGGIGYPFSKLRPKGDMISTSKGTSSGPVSFMKVLDAVAEAVKQGGCFPGSTLVAAPGGPVQIKDVKAGTIVYAYDGNKLVLSAATDSWKTKQNAEVWKLTTDKGFILYATPDHPILMRESGNGKKVYKRLKDLAVGDRIMPFTRYRKQAKGNKEWFLSIRDGNDTRVPEHRLVGSFLGFDAKNHFHHIDFDHENNHPSNLQELSHSEHAFLHGKIVGQRNDFRLLNLTPEERQKAINGYKETYAKLPENEKERRRKAYSLSTKEANQKRLELGSHNFTNNPPMKHRNILIDKMQVCISSNAYKIINSGGELSESKWEDQQKKLGLYNTQRFKLETVNKYFGSWSNFIDYIDKNNHKVVSVEFSHYEDVYNVEVPGPHNYVICNKEMTTGIFVSNTRRIAQMGIMSVHHPDILEFIKCKNEEGQIKNFNISVAITDKFMEAVKAGGDYELINPTTKKTVAKIQAKPVWDEIVAGAWLNGEPGVVFIDTINKYHNLKKCGQIWSTNPCSEQPLLPYEACVLGSIDVGKLVEDKTFGWDELKRLVKLSTRFLDNTVTLSNAPISEINETVAKNRKIGLGIMGFADCLIQLGIQYGDDQSFGFAEKLARTIKEAAHEASVELGLERGVPENVEKYYQNTTPGTPNLKGKPRNACVVSYAPTGTIASIADASFGIEPLYDVCFVKNILDGKRVFFVSDIVAQHLKGLGYDKVIKEIENGKSLEEVDLPKKIKALFATAYSLTPTQHVKMQAAFQKYCDSAISKTCNLPNSATKEDVANIYIMAHELGCKGITVYRDGSRKIQVVEVGKGKTAQKEAIKRPEVVSGLTYKIPTSFGKLYMTVNRDGDTPIEVFFSMADISNDMASLLSGLGRLLSVSLKHGTPIKDIIKTLKKVKVGTVIHYNGRIFKSVPQLVASVLEEVFVGAKQTQTLVALCDKCGSQLIMQSGCETCSNPDCGYTKCG